MELRVDKDEMRNAFDSIKFSSTSYSKLNGRMNPYMHSAGKALSIAQSLRQKTLGRVNEIDIELLDENSLGYYFAKIESNLIQIPSTQFASSVDEHYDLLEELTELYNKRSQIPKIFFNTNDPSMQRDFYQMLQHLEEMICQVNTAFGKKGCFIATAVYGDINAPEVQTLREFRDSVLMNSDLGRRIVDWYYGGVGERIAEFIRTQTPCTIPVIRRGLDYLVNQYQHNLNDY